MSEARARPRRAILSVPGSSERFLARASGRLVDEVMLDLEDGVAAGAKDRARSLVAEALATMEFEATTLAVRVNGWATPWLLLDLAEIFGRGARRLDVVVLPKVREAAHVRALDLVLTQLERVEGLPVGRIGIEALIEDATALTRIDEIAAASPRLEALALGPGDMLASLGLPTLRVGALPPDYPGDPLHHVYGRILVAARAHDLQAIDGPYVAVRDLDGFRAATARAAALGFDGAWVLHPDQIPIAHAAFTPTDEVMARAREMVEAAERAAADGVGAVMVGAEMVDEAGVQVARRTLLRAGLDG